jgi:hypothetical protein
MPRRFCSPGIAVRLKASREAKFNALSMMHDLVCRRRELLPHRSVFSAMQSGFPAYSCCAFDIVYFAYAG